METSERAKAFLASLDDEALQVGGGSDGKPVWIGVDAEAGRVYKVYANGLAQGFGDGKMTVRCGLRKAGQWCVEEGTQLTAGSDAALWNDEQLRTFKCDAGPTPASATELGDDPVLFEIRLPTGEVAKLTLRGNFEGLPAGSQVTNLALPLWNAMQGALHSRPKAAEPQPHPLMPFPLVLRSFKLPSTGDQVHVSIGTPDDTWSVGMDGKTLFEAAGSLMRWADMVGGFGKLREQSVDNVRAAGLRPVGNPNDAEISRIRWELSAVPRSGKSDSSAP